MKSIRSLFSLGMLALATLFVVPEAQAQNHKASSILGGTANSPASTDNTTFYTTNSTTMYVGQALDVAIQIDFKLQGAGTTAVVFRFDESVDGTSWTASTRLMTNTPAGTTLVSKTQTFTVGATPYLRLASVNNGSATAVTNLIVKYAWKPIR